MIHSVSANMASFHQVKFSAGLNIVLAERTKESTSKDTRNGLGKSTLIEILDFCLGSRPRRGAGLMIEQLKEWTFTLDMTLLGGRVRVTRALKAPSRVVVEGATDGWAEQPELDEKTGDRVLKVDDWRRVLGEALFSTPRSADGIQYHPRYRSLVSYFIRRGPDAYSSPFRHFRQQKTWDIQVHTAYLLGLNWEYAARWQVIRDKSDGITAVEKAMKTGALQGAVGSVGELETKRIQLEAEAAKARDAVENFNVHPEYEEIQREADRLTGAVHVLVNENVTERRRLTLYRESIRGEAPPSDLLLEQMYEESGVVFAEGARRTLQEAREFHHQIVQNRREFLLAEITRIERTIDGREHSIKELADKRMDVLQVLQAHGALSEMQVLQERFVGIQTALEHVEVRLKETRDLKDRKRELRSERDELARTAERDHEERRSTWAAAVRLFNENSQALYHSPGKLIIDVGETGYKYAVDIERSGSEGIEKMKVFCYDLAVLQLQVGGKRGIEFLVHDTLMYDSVDPRQRARALERAEEVTQAIGAQYICTMNSDMLPTNDFTAGFDVKDHVRLVLSDATPEGSLLGVRF